MSVPSLFLSLFHKIACYGFVYTTSYINVILFIRIDMCTFDYSLLGTDGMRSKTKRKITVENKSKQRKHKMKLNPTTYARRCVTHRAESLDEQCLMRIILSLSSNKQ